MKQNNATNGERLSEKRCPETKKKIRPVTQTFGAGRFPADRISRRTAIKLSQQTSPAAAVVIISASAWRV